MTCKECKHWREEKEDWTATGIGFRKCMAIRERWRIEEDATRGLEYDDVEGSDFVTKRRNAFKTARAYVQDGSEYVADLITGPDFGCVLFAAI